MISEKDIISAGKHSRSQAVAILGNCDFIVDEFRKALAELDGIKKEHIHRYPVTVTDNNGNTYSDGHTIARIDGEKFNSSGNADIYVDLSLDQFCDEYKEHLGISFGDKSEISDIIMMKEGMYDIINNTDRSQVYQRMNR